jgi:hypothetical protein
MKGNHHVFSPDAKPGAPIKSGFFIGLRKVIEDLWFEHPANGGVWHTRREPTQATVSPESEAA